MSSLAIAACVVGGILALSGMFALLAPNALRHTLLAFPRSKLPAWLLTAFDLTWVAWVILHAALGRFEPLKPAAYVAAPVAFVAIIVLMDELLAPRALGGLLLLVANPVLNAARWHESNLRLVMTVLAYLWVIAGIVLVLSPYRFRQVVAFGTKTNARIRILGLVRCAVAALLLFLGLRVY